MPEMVLHHAKVENPPKPAMQWEETSKLRQIAFEIANLLNAYDTLVRNGLDARASRRAAADAAATLYVALED